MNTKKKTAFVTGASRGIGEATARMLGQMGYDLALVCEKNEDRLAALARELQGGGRATGVTPAAPSGAATPSGETASGGEAPSGAAAPSGEAAPAVLTFTGDLSDPNFVDETAAAVLRAFGHIDVVVNNAGIAHYGLFTDLSNEAWRRVMDVNLSAVFYCCRAFAPAMIRRKSGRIINISSMWGQTGGACEAAYSAAKGGVDALTKALAKELAPSGIAVNAISPGVIETQMNAHLTGEERSALVEEIPADRFGTPEEVAAAVACLLDAPLYLTGQIIGVNGGL